MKQLILILWGMLYITLQAQIPYTNINPGNFPFTSGFHDFQGTYLNVANVNYQNQGSSQLTLRAKQQVHIQPDFEAFGLIGSGYTHVMIDPNILNIASFHPNGFSNIPKYSRFEIGVMLPASIQQQIDNFIANGTSGPNAINPYDPDQITIMCSYHGPNGATPLYRHGFYYVPFTSDLRSDTWTEQSSDYKFRVRFAPPLNGHYTAHLHLLLNGNLINVTDFEFDVSANNSHGQLNVDQNGRRKLVYDDGTVFFGIGENIAWASNDPVNLNNIAPVSPLPATPVNHNRHRQWINDLGAYRGNFVRIRLDPWSVPVETKDFGSPNPMPNISYLNNYHHNQKSMWEMDNTLELCEFNDTKILLTLFLGEFAANSYYGDGWSDSPYSALLNDPTPAGISGFFAQPIAKDYFKKRLYYIAARWGYSTSIALWSLINETENMNQYSVNQSDVIKWTCEMKDYLHTFYPAHPVTSGIIFSTSNFNDYGCLDVYQQHEYRGYSDGTNYQNDNDNLNNEAEQFFNTGKPMVYGELGYLGCTGKGSFAGDESIKVDHYNDRDFHNRLWATTMGGCLATGLNFHDWVETFVPHRANNFPALRAFIDQVDLTKMLIPNRLNPNGQNVIVGSSGKEIFNFSMETPSGDYLVGWSQIGSSFWANDNPTTFNGEFPTIQTCIPTNPQGYDVASNPSAEPFILIPSLSQANTMYTVQFFNTYGNGGPIGSPLVISSDGNADIKIWRIFNLQDNNAVNGATGPDVAYIVQLAEGERQGRKISPDNKSEISPQLVSTELPTLERINVYPVPAADKLYINFDRNHWKSPTVIIQDALGRSVKTKIRDDDSIDLNSFTNGFYLLKFTDGKHEKVIKITIER